jgi:lipase
VNYSTFDVPVTGGQLRVAQWGDGKQVLLAAHGITGTHRHFAALAHQLAEEFTVVAPDLRGRGRSNNVDGSYSMGTHADDLVAVLDHLGCDDAIVAGHSMGGFAGVVLASRQPQRVRHLVLIDGGIPLDLGPLADLPTEQLLAALIGPALDRLRMTFPTVQAYFDYWRAHPALAGSWNGHIEQAFEYELEGQETELRSSIREAAVMGDAESELVHDDVEQALTALTTPTTLLRAERGILNQEPPLYPDAAVQPWRERLPSLRVQLLPDTNHYTIILTEGGAKLVADAVREAP